MANMEIVTLFAEPPNFVQTKNLFYCKNVSETKKSALFV